MNYEIKNIDSREEWTDFEQKYAPHSFLHTWEWGLAQQELGYKIFRLGIYQAEQLVGIAFVYKIKAKRGSFLFCPHGPLINYQEKDIFYELINYIKKLAQQEKVDFIRISPLLKDSQNNQDIFKNLGFKNAPIHMHPEIAWILDIKADSDQLLREMKKRTRYSINKAQRDGVKIIKTKNINHIDEFYNLYQKTANRQDFVPFSKEYIQKEFEIFSSQDKAMMFFAYYQDIPIATAIIIFANNSGFYHHGASIRKFAQIPASELLQWEAILEAKFRGSKLYNFWGIAPLDKKRHPWQGLSRFKMGFGGFAEEYIHAQDLILSPKYFVNYLIESIRKIKRGY